MLVSAGQEVLSARRPDHGSKTVKSRGPGKRGAGKDQGSLAPLPPLADEETDPAAVSALLRGLRFLAGLSSVLHLSESS